MGMRWPVGQEVTEVLTEREKLELGLPYYTDGELLGLSSRARELTRLYNLTGDADAERREELLDLLSVRRGANVRILPDFRCQVGFNIAMGDDVFVNFGCTLLDNAPITIGSGVLIGPHTSLYTVNHAIDREERARGLCRSAPIVVGDGVWLAGNVVVTPGVTVGEGSVVGAGSVVTRDVPPGVIAAGNPCRVLREVGEKDRLLFG